MILNETYYGKNPKLLECEQCFTDIKAYLKAGKDPNSCPSVRKMENNLSQLFGFEKTKYAILAENYSGNSMTTPFCLDFSKPYKDEFYDLTRTKEGIRFKNPKGKILYVYVYNECLRNIPSDELVAILIHEIGHNFYLVKEQVNYTKQFFLNEMILNILEFIKNNNYSRYSYNVALKLMMKYVVKIKKDGACDYFYNDLKEDFSKEAQNRANREYELADNNFTKLLYMVSKLVVTFFTLPFNIGLTLILPLLFTYRYYYCNIQRNNEWKEQFRNSQNYNNEKFADNFAATYGYGVEVAKLFSNASSKFSYYGKIDENIPIMRVYYYYDEMLSRFVFAFANEHPDDLKRCVFMIEKLKYELKNNEDLTAAQKQELNTQIDKIEDILKNRPLYKKGIDAIFASGWKMKDKAASTDKYSQEEIFNFDKKLLKDNVK